MKEYSQPIIVETSEGGVWLREGYLLFKKQPLVWILSLLSYWTAMFIFGLIPIFGFFVSLILSPGLAFGFVALAKAIDSDQLPRPKILISGFLSNAKLQLLFLGIAYFIALFVLLGIVILLDGRSLTDVLSQNTKNIETNSLQPAIFIGVFAYIPVIMAFWFAPQLVVWGNLPATKALFYSFFAVLLNWKSFLVYLFFWIVILLVASLLVSFFTSITQTKQAIFISIFPLTLIIMSIAHGSYYASTISIFNNLNLEQENKNRLH
ncbi:MAG: hypothetical protein CBC42_06675 [Betaproteobacteria bacterium TMED82]|nr:MAG: hypothetical protein CBC42_06675 [Betaproteobacteria bacterium TMED82]